MTFVEQLKALTFVIRHFVFFSAHPGQLDVVYEGLQILEDIPHADLVEVRLNDKLDQLSNEVDVVVYAEFGSDDALLQFKAHPLCQETIERVRPNREPRLVADTRS